jgi:hypothetical protein
MFFTIAAVCSLFAAAGLAAYWLSRINEWGVIAVLGMLCIGAPVVYLSLCVLGACPVTTVTKVIGWPAFILSCVCTLYALGITCFVSFVGRAFAGSSPSQLREESYWLGWTLGYASLVLTCIKVLFLMNGA